VTFTIDAGTPNDRCFDPAKNPALKRAIKPAGEPAPPVSQPRPRRLSQTLAALAPVPDAARLKDNAQVQIIETHDQPAATGAMVNATA